MLFLSSVWVDLVDGLRCTDLGYDSELGRRWPVANVREIYVQAVFSRVVGRQAVCGSPVVIEDRDRLLGGDGKLLT